MGLIDLLDHVAASRAHVLVAEAPGAFRTRVALERAVDHAGWCLAQSVADADVLAVVGESGDDLSRVIEHAWAQMSEPRTRVHLHGVDDVPVELALARDRLRAGGDVDGKLRRGFTPSSEDTTQHGGHEEHGGHDHGAMTPDGIPLAEGADDRDGLEMDVSHLSLGPVLAHWPPGLVLTATLHGDVVVEAEVEQLSATHLGDQAEEDRAARLLDAAASVLALAGLPGEAARARGLRDRCLESQRDVGADVARLAQRLRARRSLRWVLAGLTVTGSHGGHGSSESLHERLVGLLARAQDAIAQEPATRTRLAPVALPPLLRGKELAEVRLWVAALAPDLAAHEVSEVGHG